MGVYIYIDTKGGLTERGVVDIEGMGPLFDVAILVHPNKELYACLHHGANIVGKETLKQHLEKYHQEGDDPKQCSTCMTDLGTNGTHRAGKAHMLNVQRRGWRLCLECFAVIKPGVKHSNHGEQFFFYDLFEKYGVPNDCTTPSRDERVAVSDNAIKSSYANRGRMCNDRANRTIATLALGAKIANEKGKRVASQPMCGFHLELITGYKVTEVIPGCNLLKVTLKCKCCEGIGRMLGREPANPNEVFVVTSDTSNLKLIESPHAAGLTEKEDVYPEFLQYSEVQSLTDKHGPEVIALYQVDIGRGCFRLRSKVKKAVNTGVIGDRLYKSPLAEAKFGTRTALESEDVIDGKMDESDDDPDPFSHADDEGYTAPSEACQNEEGEASALSSTSGPVPSSSSLDEEAAEDALDDVDGRSHLAMKRLLTSQMRAQVEQENAALVARIGSAAVKKLAEGLDEESRDPSPVRKHKSGDGDKAGHDDRSRSHRKVEEGPVKKAPPHQSNRFCGQHKRILNNGRCPVKGCATSVPPPVSPKHGREHSKRRDQADGPLKGATAAESDYSDSDPEDQIDAPASGELKKLVKETLM